MKNTPEAERKERNAAMEISKKNGIQVKVINNRGFIIHGAIGVGFGAWSRAGYIQKYCSLTELPQSVSRKEWLALDAETELVPWKN